MPATYDEETADFEVTQDTRLSLTDASPELPEIIASITMTGAATLTLVVSRARFANKLRVTMSGNTKCTIAFVPEENSELPPPLTRLELDLSGLATLHFKGGSANLLRVQLRGASSFTSDYASPRRELDHLSRAATLYLGTTVVRDKRVITPTTQKLHVALKKKKKKKLVTINH